MLKSSENPEALRAAFYVDGFNVYHGIASLHVDHLKWLNWWSLANAISASRNHNLVKVDFCTAPPKFKTEDVQRRHASYTQALESFGVRILSGFFLSEPVDCKKCTHTWNDPQEKEGDVNLAVSLIGDAYQDLFDIAYIVTADNDQAPTLRHLAKNFSVKSAKPKNFVVILPPNRTSRSLSAIAAMNGKNNIIIMDRIMIEGHLLPEKITYDTKAGTARTVYRPEKYALPVKKIT